MQCNLGWVLQVELHNHSLLVAENEKKEVFLKNHFFCTSVGAPAWSISMTMNCENSLDLPPSCYIKNSWSWATWCQNCTSSFLGFLNCFSQLLSCYMLKSVSIMKVWRRLRGQESDVCHPSEFRGIFWFQSI